MRLLDYIHNYVYFFYKRLLKPNDSPLGYSIGIFSLCITLNIFTAVILIKLVYPILFDFTLINVTVIYLGLAVLFYFRYYKLDESTKNKEVQSNNRITSILIISYLLLSFFGAFYCFIFLGKNPPF